MMIWLLAGYMWLFIHRPFEVWPWLGEYRIERIYMLITIAAWLCTSTGHWTRNRLNGAFLAFFVALVAAWLASPFRDIYACAVEVEIYAKMAVFYVLVMSCIRDARQLRFLVSAFLVCTALYMAHSLWEYYNGRHWWKMGTARMVGVDFTMSDPNSFACTLIYALPMTMPFWRTKSTRRETLLLVGYTILTAICVLLTGSRTGFIGLAAVAAAFVAMSAYRWRLAVALATLVPIAWFLLPADRQNRYLTLYDPSYGPANAQASAEGRAQGFYDGLKNWRAHPVFGVGPAAHGLAIGHGQQSHNLYGQVAGEMGTIGILVFGAMLVGYILNYRDARWLTGGTRRADRPFSYHVAEAVMVTIVLLLVLGWGAHNLLRYTWLWYGAFQGIAVCALRKSDAVEYYDVERQEWPIHSSFA